MSYRVSAAYGQNFAPDQGGADRRAYFIGTGRRGLRLGPIGFWTVVLALVIMAVWSAGTATYFLFRESVLSGLMARQAEMQYAYEDRIAGLRAQMDRVNSRQLLDQEQVERRILQLAKRQSALESRASILNGITGDTPGVARGPRPGEPAGPQKPSPLSDSGTPAPERHSALYDRNDRTTPLLRGTQRDRLNATLVTVEESLDRIEASQAAALLAMEDRYGERVRRIRGVLADLGMNVGQLAAPVPATEGVGGPFIPLPNGRGDTGAFERQLQRVQVARAQADRLGRVLVTLPVRRPLAGEIDTTSGFGVRTDPFLRAPALHSGLDFRASPGDVVRVTAAGKVTSAGWNGGYGRMVEVDHGNGFATRYAHLSDILVKEDQVVRAGQIVGRVGSTGRSTGPHLHYETRIDGEAVDPLRFLRAGLRLGDKH